MSFKSLRSYVVESKITTSIFYVRTVREITKLLIRFVFFLKWAGFLRIEKELQTLSTILCRKQWKRSWILIIFSFRRRDDFESLQMRWNGNWFYVVAWSGSFFAHLYVFFFETWRLAIQYKKEKKISKWFQLISK